MDHDLFMDYWQIPLRIIGEQLDSIQDEKITGDVSVADYDKNWPWLVAQSKGARRE
jgi:hypothetical protein